MRLSKTVLGLAAAITLTALTGGGTVYAQTAPAPQMVTVQPGDSLSTIAAANNTTYIRLFDANPTIQDPNVIQPNDVLRIPAADEQLASRPLPGAEAPAPTVPATAAPAPALAPVTAAAPAPAPAAPSAVPTDDNVWDALAQCESGGNWSADSGTYRGGLQFVQTTWEANGGAPGSNPAAASREEQIAIAKNVQASQGWGAWPACSEKLGLL